MSRARDRRLLVGPDVYRWRVLHRHRRTEVLNERTGRPSLECRETLTLRREGAPGIVRIVFVEGPGRIVSGGFFMHSGAVARSGVDGYLNLHRPAHARALLDAALADGAGFDAQLEIDGWRLFDTALAALT